MANQRVLIKEGGLAVVGRYMDGAKVVGYHLQSDNGMGGGRVTKQQLYELIQKGAITNCTAQLYKGDVLFRGKGDLKISDLPIVDDKTGEYKNIDGMRKNMQNGQLGQVTIIQRRMVGKKLHSVVCVDASGVRRIFFTNELMTLAQKNMIINCKTQMYNGKTLLRYIDGDNIETIQYLETASGKKWARTPEGLAWAQANGEEFIPPEVYRYLADGTDKYRGGICGTNAIDALNVMYYIMNNGNDINANDKYGTQKLIRKYAATLSHDDKRQLKKFGQFLINLDTDSDNK